MIFSTAKYFMVHSLCLRAIKSVPKSDPSEILRRNSAFVIHYFTLKIRVKIKLKLGSINKNQINIVVVTLDICLKNLFINDEIII